MSICTRIRTWRTKTTRDTAVVMLTITADTSQFDAGMARAARAGEQFREIRFQNHLRGERTAARRWWGDYITSVYAEYGWEWPGPVDRSAS